MINFNLTPSPKTENATVKAKSIQETIQAISRSREILEKAEQAVTRSYAIVEISRDFLIHTTSASDKVL